MTSHAVNLVPRDILGVHTAYQLLQLDHQTEVDLFSLLENITNLFHRLM